MYREPVKRGKVSSKLAQCSPHLHSPRACQAASDGDDAVASSEALSDTPVEEKVTVKSPRKVLSGTKREVKKPMTRIKAEKEVEHEGSSDLSEMEESKPVEKRPVSPVRYLRD